MSHEIGPDSVTILAGIFAEPDAGVRRRALEDFYRKRFPLIRRWAAKLARDYSAPDHEVDEVFGIMVEEIWAHLLKMEADPTLLANLGVAWEVYARTNAAAQRSKAYLIRLNNPEGIAADRRYREVARTRRDFTATHHREPTAQEIIQATQARLDQTQDTARSGMIITESDLSRATYAELPADDGPDRGSLATDSHDDYLLHPAEGRWLIEATIAECEEGSYVLGQVARVWLAFVYNDASLAPFDSFEQPEAPDALGAVKRHDGHPESRPEVYLARQMGLTRAQSRAHVEQVREVARRLVVDNLGIESA